VASRLDEYNVLPHLPHHNIPDNRYVPSARRPERVWAAKWARICSRFSTVMNRLPHRIPDDLPTALPQPGETRGARHLPQRRRLPVLGPLDGGYPGGVQPRREGARRFTGDKSVHQLAKDHRFGLAYGDLVGSYPNGRIGPCGKPAAAFCSCLRQTGAERRPDSFAANAAKMAAMNNPSSSLPRSMSAVTVATSRTPASSQRSTNSSNSTGSRCNRSKFYTINPSRDPALRSATIRA